MDTANRFRRVCTAVCLLGAFVGLAAAQMPPAAQPPLSPEAAPSAPIQSAQPNDPLRFRVDRPTERLEMIINSSRILEFAFDVPRLLVNNPDVVAAAPLTPNSVQISARKQGYTQLNVWDPAGKVTTVDVIVIGDVRELEIILAKEFPDAGLRLRPLNSSLYISGFVPKADMVGQIVRVAEDYFPKVVNNITVGGVQKVLLHVKVMEVSRTKLRTLGFDWQLLTADGSFVTQGAGNVVKPLAQGALNGLQTVGNNNVRFGVVGTDVQFFGFLDMLAQNNLAKLMAEPTLTTMSGRPASFNVGGEIPVPLLSANGAPSILFREFGTQIDFVPIVLGNGLIRLEVRPAITEVDASLAVSGVPGFRTRRADVGVEMRAGQTLAIAGLVYQKVEAETRGVPVLMDLPWVGTAFRRVTDKINEVELVITVRPEFAAAMDPCEVPPCGPGQLTTQPNEVELYGRAYLEVPKCCDDRAYTPYAGQNAGMPGAVAQGPGVYDVHAHQSASRPAAAPAASGANARPSAPPAQSQPVQQSAGNSARRTTPSNTASYNPQTRANTALSQPQSAKTTVSKQPGLIGPLGYDELR